VVRGEKLSIGCFEGGLDKQFEWGQKGGRGGEDRKGKKYERRLCITSMGEVVSGGGKKAGQTKKGIGEESKDDKRGEKYRKGGMRKPDELASLLKSLREKTEALKGSSKKMSAGKMTYIKLRHETN